MFEAYITNTALYPLMGIEVGTTVHFPMTTQELQAALAKIGIDGKRYSEVFFTSFDSDVLGLYDYLYECENIDELNELGHALLEVRDKGGLETFEAALVLGNHTRSVKDMLHKCWTGAYCRYFREAVLPLDPELQAALTTEGISPELRACAVCGKAFLPEGRQAYCSDACKAEGNRRKSRERMRKMREKRPGGCYDLPPPKA